MNQILTLGIIAVTGVVLLSSKVDTNELIKEVLSSTKLSKNEKYDFQTRIFPNATQKEIIYIHGLLIKGKKPSSKHQINLHNTIGIKYQIFT